MLHQISFFLVVMMSTFSLAAQSEFEQIEETLNHYLYGTSYNDLERIDSAFYKDATLYLTGPHSSVDVKRAFLMVGKAKYSKSALKRILPELKPKSSFPA